MEGTKGRGLALSEWVLGDLFQRGVLPLLTCPPARPRAPNRGPSPTKEKGLRPWGGRKPERKEKGWPGAMGWKVRGVVGARGE